ncbi:hypothetical protein BKA69DRAFT_1176490 [Paraphysoderma sedebokerense]|nr:hypothetical protein BKA69DRAFT_1176490 [Paraphysoderma sedebokerense]
MEDDLTLVPVLNLQVRVLVCQDASRVDIRDNSQVVGDEVSRISSISENWIKESRSTVISSSQFYLIIIATQGLSLISLTLSLCLLYRNPDIPVLTFINRDSSFLLLQSSKTAAVRNYYCNSRRPTRSSNVATSCANGVTALGKFEASSHGKESPDVYEHKFLIRDVFIDLAQPEDDSYPDIFQLKYSAAALDIVLPRAKSLPSVLAKLPKEETKGTIFEFFPKQNEDSKSSMNIYSGKVHKDIFASAGSHLDLTILNRKDPQPPNNQMLQTTPSDSAMTSELKGPGLTATATVSASHSSTAPPVHGIVQKPPAINPNLSYYANAMIVPRIQYQNPVKYSHIASSAGTPAASFQANRSLIQNFKQSAPSAEMFNGRDPTLHYLQALAGISLPQTQTTRSFLPQVHLTNPNMLFPSHAGVNQARVQRTGASGMNGKQVPSQHFALKIPQHPISATTANLYSNKNSTANTQQNLQSMNVMANHGMVLGIPNAVNNPTRVVAGQAQWSRISSDKICQFPSQLPSRVPTPISNRNSGNLRAASQPVQGQCQSTQRIATYPPVPTGNNIYRNAQPAVSITSGQTPKQTVPRIPAILPTNVTLVETRAQQLSKRQSTSHIHTGHAAPKISPLKCPLPVKYPSPITPPSILGKRERETDDQPHSGASQVKKHKPSNSTITVLPAPVAPIPTIGLSQSVLGKRGRSEEVVEANNKRSRQEV